MADPYGTAALRAAVLDAWDGSATRFREDANAEEDLRLGGYAQAWFVELAQNAADAARAGGVPGRLLVSAADGELRVANTGAELDAAGVVALASLRASAKRDDGASVGRFGVGFAAVLALSDEPRVVSAGGGVGFSAARTAAAIAGLAGPSAELARRDGQLPILRLVWPVEADEAQLPPGFDTEVRLPLRDGLDATALLDDASAQASALLLALPDLVEITVGDGSVRRVEGSATVTRVESSGQAPIAGLTGAARADGLPGAARVAGGPAEVRIDAGPAGFSRWLLVRRAGRLDMADAATLAVEQRGRIDWSVCWALPLDDDGNPAPLDTDGDPLHAPTATDERLSLPARLLATVALEPDRRRVRPGPATDRVLAAAAAAYVELVRAVAPQHRLALVPAAGFPRSELDAQLRELVLDELRAAAWLPAAGGGELAPGRARWLDLPSVDIDDVLPDPRRSVPAGAVADDASPGAGRWPDTPASGRSSPSLPELLARTGAFPGLLAHRGFAGPRAPAALTELGVIRLAPAQLVDQLLGVRMPPPWWSAVYAQLALAADTVPGLLDELRALPVPLLDGRTVPGPVTVLLPVTPASPAVAAVAALGLPGLHVAHPDLADLDGAAQLLARLGAAPAGPERLLDHPAMLAAVARSVPDAEYDAAEFEPLAAAVLALVTEAGPGAAGPELAALALPDADGAPARADELMLPDAALRPLLADDVPLDVLDPSWADRYPREVLTAVGVVDGFVVLVEDAPTGPDHHLDDEQRWWESLDGPPSRLVAIRDLDLVADDAWPAALALLAAHRDTRDAIVAPSGGDRSYSAWWLARHTRLGGYRPGHWRLPSVGALDALYDPLPPATHNAVHGSAVGHSTRPGSGAVHSAALDERFLAAVGVRATLDVPDAAGAADLLARLADPARRPDLAIVAAAHAELAAAVLDGRVDPDELAPPRFVRALDGSVVDVDVAVVLDQPWLSAVLPAGEVVAGGDPAALAELLDLPLASAVVAGTVDGSGTPVRWTDLPDIVLACQALNLPVPDGELHHHQTLTVTLTRPTPARYPVPAWRDREGRWHATDPLRALLLGLIADPH